MKKLIAVASVLLIGSAAHAYDTGSMSCEDIGQFASAVVEGKGKGTTYKQAVAKIEKTVPAKYKVERKNCKDIVKLLYVKEEGKHLNTDGAYSVMKADCMAQQ